ncbi:hypothetical protein GCM10028791_40000 [Echinicola sediminis]
MRHSSFVMLESVNINFDKVNEMAEGDPLFKKELLQAISDSVVELKERYNAGIKSKNVEALNQARHKVKPTILVFELRKLSDVLETGKKLMESEGIHADLLEHQEQFLKTVEDLLSEIERSS